MNAKLLRKILLIGLLATLLTAFSLGPTPNRSVEKRTTFLLEAPVLLAAAQEQDVSIASVISDEAGISAYFKAATAINLNNVRPVYRTIEAETSTYILGSVPVGEYPESEDVHVYVNTDGWILAYYLKADPVAKVFDWRAYRQSGETELTTKLENTLLLVSTYAGVPYPGGTYYHFQFPNSTDMMLVADWGYGYPTDPFEVKLPGTFVFYERSWSLGTINGAVLRLNATELGRLQQSGSWLTDQGTLTAGQLLPDVFHTIDVTGIYYNSYAYGGLALIYRVP
jgi:hypothetical protein